MKYNNTLTNKIYDILLPLVGDTMSVVSIQLQSKKIGADPEAITKTHLPQLAAEFQKSLIVFLGTDGAAKIGAKIKAITG